MAVTLTIEHIPENVYERLKRSAELHRRSLNTEAILCLQAVRVQDRLPPSERIARARALRAQLPQVTIDAREIEVARRQGRRP